MHIEQILIKPLLTEKATIETENNNRYLFQVLLGANKNQIRLAVEKLFNVKVIDVKTTVQPGKMKKYGRFSKKTESTKKAYVKIQDGQKLELFKGI